jgi:hypothetical protein
VRHRRSTPRIRQRHQDKMAMIIYAMTDEVQMIKPRNIERIPGRLP